MMSILGSAVILIVGGLCIGLLGAVLTNVIYKLRDEKATYSPKLFIKVFVSIIFILSISLIVIGSNHVANVLEVRAYPTAEGKVLSSLSIKAGRSSFVPEVEYTYVVKSDTFINKQQFVSPQFGTKDTREQSTESILKKYPVGSKVIVYYNPNNPQEASTYPSFSWDVFIRLGTGVFLWVMTSWMVGGYFIGRILR